MSSSRFFTYLPWFVAGFVITGERFAEWKARFSSCGRLRHTCSMVLAFIGVVAYLVLIYRILPPEIVALNRQLSTGYHTAVDIRWVFGFEGQSMLWALGLVRLLHYGLVLLLGVAVVVLCPIRECFLSKWGRNSLQVYVVHLVLLYIIDGVCGLDAVGDALGLSGDWWAVVFPIVGGFAVTAILAVSNRPNRWMRNLKGRIKGCIFDG